MKNIIKVSNLVKNYGSLEAVKNISFTVEEGKFYAFLGENGAGKSTTINILSTLLKKTSGEVIINFNELDKQDNKIRKDIGVVFQGNMLDGFLTVKENLICRGTLYGLSKKEIISRMNLLADKIGIAEFLDRPYKKLSGGQKRRADIVRALINKPKILILDEPTTGLDPYTRQCVWESIMELKTQSGLTIFLTTHYMDEASQADKIIIIDKGTITECDTPEMLKLKYSFDKLIVHPKDYKAVENILQTMNRKFITKTQTIQIPLKESLEAIDLLAKLRSYILGFEVQRGNMDQVFMEATNNKRSDNNE